MLMTDDLKEIVPLLYEKIREFPRDGNSVRESKEARWGESFVFFQDKSYIGWEDLFIGSQSDLPISSLMYELIRILITILMMIYIYRIPDESIH